MFLQGWGELCANAAAFLHEKKCLQFFFLQYVDVISQNMTSAVFFPCVYIPLSYKVDIPWEGEKVVVSSKLKYLFFFNFL
ncbi:hypothetical protein GDO81_025380 [Engystomops pustulosus]|uniref:Uncharacterized protein n=1 Tax=Engystomops pustulosus TaxID=76066 RepID=A0AAV6YT48_ENGPU|nr:hypothetical protein GDO81_025380 [Engystomops pustulosus]